MQLQLCCLFFILRVTLPCNGFKQSFHRIGSRFSVSANVNNKQQHLLLSKSSIGTDGSRGCRVAVQRSLLPGTASSLISEGSSLAVARNESGSIRFVIPVVKPLVVGSIATVSLGSLYWALFKDLSLASTLQSVSEGSLAERRSQVGTQMRHTAQLASLPLSMFLLWRFLRFVDERNVNMELRRIQRYKEEMYFEAVQQIMLKLNDPRVSVANEDNLKKQLLVLDPSGAIREYIISGGRRPDITELANDNARRYSTRSIKQEQMVAEKVTSDKFLRVQSDLQELLKKIDSSLSSKYDGATRKRITDKIKRAFVDFDEAQSREALNVLSGNIENDKYWVEFIDKLS